MGAGNKVVILGCGPLGSKTASELDKDFDVTVVERLERAQSVLSSPRAFVQEGFEAKIFFPYDRLLKRGRVIHDEAVEIQERAVVLKSGSVINFDYLVIATGSKYFSPIKSEKETQEAEKMFRKYQEAFKTAKTAVVVGGGNSGIEIASEIKYFFPQIEVTLVNSGAKLMHTTPGVTEAFQDALEARLKKSGVRLMLKTKVVLTDEDRQAISTTIERRTLKTTDGREIVSDVQILAAGIGGFNSSPLRANLSDHIDPATGKVKVNKYLQLESKPHIFAGGDVALTGQYEQAYQAGEHGVLIAANIRALTKQTALKPIVVETPKHLVVMGPKGGLLLGIPFKTTILGDFVASIKSKDYLIGRMRKAYGIIDPNEASQGNLFLYGSIVIGVIAIVAAVVFFST